MVRCLVMRRQKEQRRESVCDEMGSDRKVGVVQTVCDFFVCGKCILGEDRYVHMYAADERCGFLIT